MSVDDNFPVVTKEVNQIISTPVGNGLKLVVAVKQSWDSNLLYRFPFSDEIFDENFS